MAGAGLAHDAARRLLADRGDQAALPATRVAWEQARQAAIGVGIARAAYLPEATASVIAGYEHAVAPFPSNLVPQGFITFDAREVYPQLTMGGTT